MDFDRLLRETLQNDIACLSLLFLSPNIRDNDGK